MMKSNTYAGASALKPNCYSSVQHVLIDCLYNEHSTHLNQYREIIHSETVINTNSDSQSAIAKKYFV